MNIEFETRLRSALRASTEQVIPSPTLGDDLVRLARSRRRRRVAWSAAAAAAIVAVVVLLVVGGVGALRAERRHPATSYPPIPSAAAGLSILDTDGVIHTATGGRISVPSVDSMMPAAAVPVRGGWVVDYEVPARNGVEFGPTANMLMFLGNDAAVRAFTPALREHDIEYAVSADGSRLAAYLDHTIYVFDLPSRRVVATHGVTRRDLTRSSPIWYAGERVVTFDDDGLLVWNVRSGVTTLVPNRAYPLQDISIDGSLAVFNRSVAWTGSRGSTTHDCVAVTEFNDRATDSGRSFCDPQLNLSARRGGISPDRQWIVLGSTTCSCVPSDVVIYRLADVRSGVASTPISFTSQYPDEGVIFLGWHDGQVVLVDEDAFNWVLTCDPADGQCTRVGLPPSPRNVVLEHPVGLR